MFERFTRPARVAVVHAQQQAREQGSPTIGAEHLLAGVLADADGVPAAVLRRWDVDEAAAHGVVDLDDEALSALGESVKAAVRGNGREIGSAQLFLGLLATQEGTALRTLHQLGVTASADELCRLVEAEVDQAA